MIRLVVYTDTKDFELDTYGDESINITYGVDDLRDIESKTGHYSKSFDLPATKNNNRYFGYLYDLQSDVSQYDTLKGHKCQLYVNNISVFEGLLYLNEIVKLDTETKYKVNLLGESVRLIEVLGDATLSDLSFTEFTHDFTDTNINDSTDVFGGGSAGITLANGNNTQAIYYSLVQNLGIIGNNSGHITQMVGATNYQPFIRMFNIINKIFEFAGFEYDSDFFNSSLFKQIYMDTGLNDSRINSNFGSAFRFIDNSSASIVSTPSIDHLFIDANYNANAFNADTISTRFSFDQVHNITTNYTNIPYTIEPTTVSGITNDPGNLMGTNGTVTSPSDNFEVFVSLTVHVFATEEVTISIIGRQNDGSTDTDHIIQEFTMPNQQDSFFEQAGGNPQQEIMYKKIQGFTTIVLGAGDTLDFRIKKSGGDAWIARYSHNWQLLNGSTFTGDCQFHLNANFLQNTTPFQIGTGFKFYEGFGVVTENSINHAMCLRHDLLTGFYANTLSVAPLSSTTNAIQTKIHDNHGDVKLADIIKDITKMFNLVIENRNGILKIEPYNDFIKGGTTKHWSNKIDTTEILQNYERIPSKITWSYSNDENDVNLNTYKNYTDEDYGSITIQIPVDYIDEKEIKLEVFSATVFQQLSSGLRYSTCYGYEDGVYEQIENKPRLIFRNTKNIHTTLNDVTGVRTSQKYTSGGHFQKYPDDLTIADHDLNFGYTQNVFIATPFATPQNLYNKFWFDYVNERYTQERVLVKAKVYLTETDIQAFSFADTIIINNQQYRVTKIEYKAGQTDLAKVELIKI